MKQSVSNIAWSPGERFDAYALLANHNVDGLEIAPGLAFPDLNRPFDATDADVRDFLRSIQKHELVLTSMQSLLFGTSGAALFGDGMARARFREGIEAAIRLAGRLRIPNLVLGSPKNRLIPEDMESAEAREIWLDMFCRLGDEAARVGTVVALEANPTEYGTNFLTTVAQTIDAVKACAHPAVTLNLDLGALLLTGEIDRLYELGEQEIGLISHVHISSPHLKPIGPSHKGIAEMLGLADRAGVWPSVEMTGGLVALEETLNFLGGFYPVVDSHPK